MCIYSYWMEDHTLPLFFASNTVSNSMFIYIGMAVNDYTLGVLSNPNSVSLIMVAWKLEPFKVTWYFNAMRINRQDDIYAEVDDRKLEVTSLNLINNLSVTCTDFSNGGGGHQYLHWRGWFSVKYHCLIKT